MLHVEMGAVTVRVIPRSGRVAVEVGPRGVSVRVRAAPEGGRATEQARRALADALGVAPSRITLTRGMTSRVKTFEVAGLTGDDLRVRLGAT